MISKRHILAWPLAVALALTAPWAAFTQEGHSGHDMGAMRAPAGGASNPAAQGYMKAMDSMHAAMSSMSYTGDADVDFVRGMIPHHRAAIDMAKVQLQYGKDPAIRKLSEAIIAAQEDEIAEMEDWLKARQAQ